MFAVQRFGFATFAKPENVMGNSPFFGQENNFFG